MTLVQPSGRNGKRRGYGRERDKSTASLEERKNGGEETLFSPRD
jgi:hypothetical protein